MKHTQWGDWSASWADRCGVHYGGYSACLLPVAHSGRHLGANGTFTLPTGHRGYLAFDRIPAGSPDYGLTLPECPSCEGSPAHACQECATRPAVCECGKPNRPCTVESDTYHGAIMRARTACHGSPAPCSEADCEHFRIGMARERKRQQRAMVTRIANRTGRPVIELRKGDA